MSQEAQSSGGEVAKIDREMPLPCPPKQSDQEYAVGLRQDLVAGRQLPRSEGPRRDSELGEIAHDAVCRPDLISAGHAIAGPYS